MGMLRAAEMRERGIHREHQVELGINEGAIEIENQSAYAREPAVAFRHPLRAPRVRFLCGAIILCGGWGKVTWGACANSLSCCICNIHMLQ